jgi:hypothetical protein
MEAVKLSDSRDVDNTANAHDKRLDFSKSHYTSCSIVTAILTPEIGLFT